MNEKLNYLTVALTDRQLERVLKRSGGAHCPQMGRYEISDPESVKSALCIDNNAENVTDFEAAQHDNFR